MVDGLIGDLPSRAGRALAGRGLRVAVAESCTGGEVCAALTGTPGSSGWFVGGVVAYANASKIRDLGVPAALIAERGAVSPEVAAAMAAGARRLFGVDLAVATTGIAGPGGGTAEKPVGTVFIAVAAEGVSRVEPHRFTGDRKSVRHRTVVRALELLIEVLATRGEGGS